MQMNMRIGESLDSGPKLPALFFAFTSVRIVMGGLVGGGMLAGIGIAAALPAVVGFGL